MDNEIDNNATPENLLPKERIKRLYTTKTKYYYMFS